MNNTTYTRNDFLKSPKTNNKDNYSDSDSNSENFSDFSELDEIDKNVNSKFFSRGSDTSDSDDDESKSNDPFTVPEVKVKPLCVRGLTNWDPNKDKSIVEKYSNREIYIYIHPIESESKVSNVIIKLLHSDITLLTEQECKDAGLTYTTVKHRINPYVDTNLNNKGTLSNHYEKKGATSTELRTIAHEIIDIIHKKQLEKNKEKLLNNRITNDNKKYKFEQQKKFVRKPILKYT